MQKTKTKQNYQYMRMVVGDERDFFFFIQHFHCHRNVHTFHIMSWFFFHRHCIVHF